MNVIRNRLLSVLLLLAVWVASLCLVVLPAHACCQKASYKTDSALPACCVSHTTALAKAVPNHSGADPGTWFYAAPAESLRPLWASFPLSIALSRQAKHYVADQSNRHQELSVWLN